MHKQALVFRDGRASRRSGTACDCRRGGKSGSCAGLDWWRRSARRGPAERRPHAAKPFARWVAHQGPWWMVGQHLSRNLARTGLGRRSRGASWCRQRQGL